MNTLQTLWIFITSLVLIHTNEAKPKPVRLNKKEEKPKLKDKIKNLNIPIDKILIIIGLITLFILLISFIYPSGCLDSTNYYYRLGGN